MRRIPRKSLVVSLAAALSLGISATAFGDGVTDNTSQVSSGINPTLLPDVGDTAKKASLYTQVTTLDNDSSPIIPDQAAEVVQIDFPAEMKYTANGKLDKCDPAVISPLATDGAAAACADAIVGSGHAFARIPAFPTTNNETELTVVAFNGTKSVAGGGFDGDLPTILLHADNAAIPGPTVVGEIRNSPNGAAFGKQLNVPNAPDVAGDTGALVQFGAQVARSYDNGKSGNQKKKYNLISANCDDSGDGDLDFGARWVYDDTTVDTDTYAQDCTVAP